MELWYTRTESVRARMGRWMGSVGWLVLAACRGDVEGVDDTDAGPPEAGPETDAPPEGDDSGDGGSGDGDSNSGGDPEGDSDGEPTDVDSDAVDDTDAVDTAIVDTGEPGPPPCPGPPKFVPDEVWLRTRDVWYPRLIPAWGLEPEGTWNLTPVEPFAEAGSFDAADGSYLAPDAPTEAHLVYTESSCVDSLGHFPTAELTFHVVSPLHVPARLDVAAGEMLELDARIDGGSGLYACSVVFDETASVLDGCVFDAALSDGVEAGVATLRVTDVLTGETADLAVRVSATLSLSPKFSFVGLPVGTPWTPEFSPASGAVSYTLPPGWTQLGETLVPSQTGVYSIGVDEVATGRSATIAVSVFDAMRPTIDRDGAGGGVAAPLGDVTGDGVPDAAVAMASASVDAYNSGAVWVFEGSATGDPATEPYQTISVPEEAAGLGAALAVGDVIGVGVEKPDGWPDLLALASGYRVNVEGSSLLIFPGLPEGGFDDTPVIRPLAGESSLAVCDFNGDGLDDVAVGSAAYRETIDGVPYAQLGRVQIYFGADERFPDSSGVQRTARVYMPATASAAAEWRPMARTGFGSSVAAGDVDGDGYCDLAVGLPGVKPAAVDPRPSAQVQIYFGRSHGIAEQPSVIVLPADDETCSDQFGRRVALADFDLDGRADLVASQSADPRYSLLSQCAVAGLVRDRAIKENSGGALLVWPADRLAPLASGEVPRPVSTTAATWGVWQTVPAAADEGVGYALSVGDLDGDDYPDLVAGFALDEAWGKAQTVDEGVVAAWSGELLASSFDGAATRQGYLEPRMLHAFGSPSAQFGTAVAPLGRGATLAIEEVSSEAGFSYETSEAFVVGASATPAPADLPGRLGAGKGYGASVAFAPMNATGGADDLFAGVVGQAHDGFLSYGAGWWATASGGVTLAAPQRWAWTLPTGRTRDSTVATLTAQTFASDGDFGKQVGRLDFDGDGFEDLAVMNEGTRRSLWCARTSPTEYLSGYSGVWIFRGSALGMSTTPSFVLSSPSGGLSGAMGHADVNGDGKEDLILGDDWRNSATGSTWNRISTGGAEVFFGRAYVADGAAPSNVICDASAVFLGEVDGGGAGAGVAGLGDLNDDGCDDFAVTTPGDGQALTATPTQLNRGGARVVWGWGNAGCSANPRVSIVGLGGRSTSGRGYAGKVATSGDLDGDGWSDLVVADPEWMVIRTGTSSNEILGYVWISPGAHLRTVPKIAMTTQNLTATGRVTITAYKLGTMTVATESPLVPSAGRWGIEGTVVMGGFGSALAVVADPFDPTKRALAVGEPLGRRGALDRQGGVTLWRVDASDGLSPAPFGWIAGEHALKSQFGSALAAGTWAGSSAIAVGAPRADVIGVDVGAVYPVRLEVP
jgi:hypothetical protein